MQLNRVGLQPSNALQQLLLPGFHILHCQPRCLLCVQRCSGLLQRCLGFCELPAAVHELQLGLSLRKSWSDRHGRVTGTGLLLGLLLLRLLLRLRLPLLLLVQALLHLLEGCQQVLALVLRAHRDHSMHSAYTA
jgi:hypothetical protein